MAPTYTKKVAATCDLCALCLGQTWLKYSLKVHGLGVQAWCLLILPGFLSFFLQCPEVDIFRHFIIILYYIRMLQVAEPWFRSIWIVWFQFVSEAAGFLCSIIFCDIEMLKFTTTCYFSEKVPNLVHWPAFQSICPPQSWHFSLFPSCCVCPLCARCLYPDAFPFLDLEGLARRKRAAQSSAIPQIRLYKVAWPGKIPQKSQSMLDRRHFIEAFHPIPPDPFEQRMPL